MPLRTISPSVASSLDDHLLTTSAFTLPQLIELAGLAVSQAIYTAYPPCSLPLHPSPPVVIICGPGNNGADGLVAARHLHTYGYAPTIHYPYPSRDPHHALLATQLRALDIPFLPSPSSSSLSPAALTITITDALRTTPLIVDAVFGFSFHGQVRPEWRDVIAGLEEARVPVVAVDVPSGWDVERGPPPGGEVGSRYVPDVLVSLTAPKGCVRWFTKQSGGGKGKRHFVGGRFVGHEVAERFGVDIPEYKGVEQVVEVEVEEGGDDGDG